MRFSFAQGNTIDRQIWAWSLLVTLSIFAAIASGWYVLVGLPVLLMLGYLGVVDYRKLYFLLLFFIPLSTEVTLPNGFGTDLPAEPLIIGLMMVYGLHVVSRSKEVDTSFMRHPLTLILIVHVGWILVTTITSTDTTISLKWFLAKIWYVVVFYFLSGAVLKSERSLQRLFWAVFLPLLITVMVILLRHAGMGFSFDTINKVVGPFYRNHVNYACILVLFFPFTWFAVGWYRRWSAKWWLIVLGMVVLFVALYFTYTRAAYVALLASAGAYWVVRWRLTKLVLGLALVAVIALVMYLASSNRYLELAPNYQKTVTHTRFDNLLEATYKGEDISTMERVYRWIAGFNMYQQKPLVGFGPGTFPVSYKPYTVHSFRTYVSDNPEKSGIHSYYLMTMAEQGIPGLILFLALIFYTLIKGERVFHESEDKNSRRIVLMPMLSLVAIDTLLIINDMVETDKVGSFFFICMAIIVNCDLANRRRR